MHWQRRHKEEGMIMIKQIYYSAPNIRQLRQENGYFVDKTEYIAKLERISNPVFLRPRRLASRLCVRYLSIIMT